MDERTSNCCDAPVIGEIDRDGFGRCSKCKEMAEFFTDDEYHKKYGELG